jgi:hypothetical protein
MFLSLVRYDGLGLKTKRCKMLEKIAGKVLENPYEEIKGGGNYSDAQRSAELAGEKFLVTHPDFRYQQSNIVSAESRPPVQNPGKAFKGEVAEVAKVTATLVVGSAFFVGEQAGKKARRQLNQWREENKGLRADQRAREKQAKSQPASTTGFGNS